MIGVANALEGTDAWRGPLRPRIGHGLMKRILIAAFLVALCTMPAAAQTREPNVPGEAEAPKLDPKACRDRDRLQQGDTVAPRQDETPSDKLARTEGVICPPPEIDPEYPRAGAGHEKQQYAGDPAAWQPWREPECPTQIIRSARMPSQLLFGAGLKCVQATVALSIVAVAPFVVSDEMPPAWQNSA